MEKRPFTVRERVIITIPLWKKKNGETMEVSIYANLDMVIRDYLYTSAQAKIGDVDYKFGFAVHENFVSHADENPEPEIIFMPQGDA